MFQNPRYKTGGDIGHNFTILKINSNTGKFDIYDLRSKKEVPRDVLKYKYAHWY